MRNNPFFIEKNCEGKYKQKIKVCDSNEVCMLRTKYGGGPYWTCDTLKLPRRRLEESQETGPNAWFLLFVLLVVALLGIVFGACYRKYIGRCYKSGHHPPGVKI